MKFGRKKRNGFKDRVCILCVCDAKPNETSRVLEMRLDFRFFPT